MVLVRLLLGLLALSPMTGYDLKKHVDSTIRHFWAADKAQVYRALSSLVDDGYATVEVIPQTGRPDRLVHHITDAGRQALRDWLTSPLPTPADRDPFLARLFFAGDLEQDQVRDLLAQRRSQAEELLQTLLAMRTAAGATQRGASLQLATLENGLAHARAELAWLDQVEGDLS